MARLSELRWPGLILGEEEHQDSLAGALGLLQLELCDAFGLAGWHEHEALTPRKQADIHITGSDIGQALLERSA